MYKTQKEQKIDASSARNIVVEALMVAGTMIMTYNKSRIILFAILDSARSIEDLFISVSDCFLQFICHKLDLYPA